MNRNGLFGYHTGPLPIPSCGSKPVRIVYVCTWDENPALTDPAGPKTVEQVPMCGPCAEYHERGGK